MNNKWNSIFFFFFFLDEYICEGKIKKKKNEEIPNYGSIMDIIFRAGSNRIGPRIRPQPKETHTTSEFSPKVHQLHIYPPYYYH